VHLRLRIRLLDATALTAFTRRLVATAPGSNTRRITRKAILDVDVTGVCKTLENPPGNAPLALRLQASLLYGVARVYQQQCRYVLTDAEKTRDHMRRFAALWSADNTLVESAGKAK